MKIALVAVFALSLSVSGCVGMGSLPNLPSPQQVDSTIAQVQSYAQTICKFVPTAATVAGIIDALGIGGGASAVTTIASQICAAVTTARSGRGMGPPKVAGVAIRGKFVR